MEDKYRDNKRDGVASKFTYSNDTPTKENKISFKNILIISFSTLFLISIILNIILINNKNNIPSNENKLTNTITKKEIFSIRKQIKKNEQKIDSLSKKIDIYHQKTIKTIDRLSTE